VSTVRQDLMSDGSEFQVRGGATENARRASSLRKPIKLVIGMKFIT